MVTIGDVLAIVAILVGIGVTSWALMVSCMLLFPGRVERAAAAVEKHPLANIGLGAVVTLPGIVGLAMLGLPTPGGKLIGWFILLSVLGIGALGAAGLGQVAGKRLRRMAPELADYPAFVRGSAFLVTASMLPILGWFAFGPILLLESFGCGARAMLHRAERPPIMARAV